jgi:acetyl esterase/lipase
MPLVRLCLRLSLAAFLLFSAGACHAQQKIPPGVELLSDVEYGKVGERALHLEIARPKTPPAKPMPVVLWIHGGGWKEGSYKPDVLIALAARGWFTASIEYRLSGEAKWPAQIEDCKLAIRWLRANADRWGIDPKHFGVCGISAGGHLAECLGTMDEKAGFDVGANPETSSRVQAVMAESGPVDFTPEGPGVLGEKDARHAPVLLQLFGVSYDKNPALWKAASPLYQVRAGDPPFLLIAGDADEVVPKAHSERMLAALQKAGVPAELITMKNANHVLLPAKAGTPTEPSMPEMYQRIIKFLEMNLAN